MCSLIKAHSTNVSGVMPTPSPPHTHTHTPETPMTRTVSAVNISSGCLKCGIIKKSGKRSCCAPGGAWFKNCGDAGDTKFDHTWAEGVQACKDVVASVSIHTLLQAMPPDVGSTDQTRNTTQQRANVNDFGDMVDAGVRHSESYVVKWKLMTTFVFYLLLFCLIL